MKPMQGLAAYLRSAAHADIGQSNIDTLRQWATEVEQAAQPEPIKDHEIAKLVGDIAAVAREFHDHQSLRERISQLVRPWAKPEPVEPLKIEFTKEWCEAAAKREADCDFTVGHAQLAQPEPVASLYISANGEREIDDWKCELPAGRHVLYTVAKVAQPEPLGKKIGCVQHDCAECVARSAQPEPVSPLEKRNLEGLGMSSTYFRGLGWNEAIDALAAAKGGHK